MSWKRGMAWTCRFIHVDLKKHQSDISSLCAIQVFVYSDEAGDGLCQQEPSLNTTCLCPGPLTFAGWLLLMRPATPQITGDTFNCFTSSLAASLAQTTWLGICLSELIPGDSHFELQVFRSQLHRGPKSQCCCLSESKSSSSKKESWDKLACWQWEIAGTNKTFKLF